MGGCWGGCGGRGWLEEKERKGRGGGGAKHSISSDFFCISGLQLSMLMFVRL